MAEDRFGYWGKGQAYRTPQDAPVSPPICKACGSRHIDPLPWCSQTNTMEVEDDDDGE